jgi:DNA-binding transcriptional ArsR family regulator
VAIGVNAPLRSIREISNDPNAPAAGGKVRTVSIVEKTAQAPETHESDTERLVTLFSALSDSTRMEMMRLLVQRGEIGCSEFDERFALSKSTISYHTKILNAAGLIHTRREGRLFFYRPILETIDTALPGLAERLRSATD